MASNSLVSDPVDPLQSQFGVSLFSRTIRVPPPPEPKDLESIHQIMKSVNTLSSPEKVVEEAKAIVDGGSKLLESAYPKFMESVGIEWDSFALEGKENVQERRPGLGCKRARFTLKTNASTRPPAILEPTLDFEQPCDAEAFFNAFEKAEEAKRELQRLNGGTISDFNKHDQPINTRSRRPGILGYRKSYVYKHRDSSENNNSQILSQDTQELNLLASPSYETQKDKADTEFEAQETNVSGIATETEQGYKGILEELFSKNSEDLDGNGAVSILEERLSIKPISLDTFSMPGLNVGRTDFMAMREKLPKENKTLTNISSLARRLSGGDTHVKQKRVGGSPISPITSPTLPNVTVGTISLMKKRSSLCSPLRDPFSPLNLDLSEPKKAFSGDDIDKQPPQLPVRKELSCSGNLEPQVEDELGRPTDDSVELQTGVPRASESPIDCFSVKNMEPQLEDELRRSTTSRVDLQKMISRALDSPDGHCLDKSLGQGNIDEDIWPRESQGDVTECGSGDGVRENTVEESINVAIAPDRNSENVTDRSEAAVLPSQFNSHADDSTQTVQQSHEAEGIPPKVAGHANPEGNVSQLQTAENESGHLLEGQPNTAATKDNHADAPSITADIMTMKTSQKVQPKKAMTKRLRGESRELKALPRRKSLAEAGTYFESGVRRSKRIKTRPLEYWNGERLLYGRIDESIKLVGLKYISPSKGERNLKVKAYISDEYKEIIDLASRH